MITTLTILLIAVGGLYAWTFARERLRPWPLAEKPEEIRLELPWADE